MPKICVTDGLSNGVICNFPRNEFKAIVWRRNLHRRNSNDTRRTLIRGTHGSGLCEVCIDTLVFNSKYHFMFI